MHIRNRLVLLVAGLCSVAASSCVPKRDLPPDQIERLGKLADVMDVQSTVADPQFKKIGQASYDDADWAGLADMATRIQATSHKTLQFSKGPEFDKLADRLHSGAEALARATAAKDAPAASTSLAEMKATCKACHSKFD